MRSVVRSEPDAFRILLLAIAVLLPIAFVAAYGPSWLALGLGALAVGALAWRAPFRRSPPRLRLKTAPPHVGPAAERRILVVANDTLTEPALGHELARVAAAPGTHVLVLAPVLVSRRARWVGAVDAAHEQARRLLDETFERIGDSFDIAGSVSDVEPLQAIEDTLASFPADEIVISTRSERPWRGLEPRLARLARQRFAVPVSHLVFQPQKGVDASRASAAQPAG